MLSNSTRIIKEYKPYLIPTKTKLLEFAYRILHYKEWKVSSILFRNSSTIHTLVPLYAQQSDDTSLHFLYSENIDRGLLASCINDVSLFRRMLINSCSQININFYNNTIGNCVVIIDMDSKQILISFDTEKSQKFFKKKLKKCAYFF